MSNETSSTPDPLPLVKSGDEMDVDTFLKHMNARHTPLAGLAKIGRSNEPDDENETLLRAFHDVIHKNGDVPLNHHHREVPQEDS